MINIMNITTMGKKGFSLVELMVAVGIIGSMSAVAVPNYAKFKAKSLQATAQQNLSNIYTLQNLYFTEHDEYGLAADISFNPNESKYDYEVATTSTPDIMITAANGRNGTPDTDDQIGFKATAKSDGKLAACATDKDHWCVNQDKVLANIIPTGSPNPGLPCNTENNKDFIDGSCK